MLPRSSTNPVHRRMCLACGSDHASLQSRRAVFTCPSCGCDLYARPPRSYAEMEGLKPTGALHACWRTVRMALRDVLDGARALAHIALGIPSRSGPKRLARAARLATPRDARTAPPRQPSAHRFEPHDLT